MKAYQVALIAAACGAMAGYMAARLPGGPAVAAEAPIRPKAQEITASRIQIVDHEGRVRAFMGTTPDGLAGLGITRPDGTLQILMMAGTKNADHCAEIGFYSGLPAKRVARIACANDGAHFEAMVGPDKASVMAGVFKDEAVLVVRDSKNRVWNP